MGFTALDYSSAISARDLAAAGIDTVFRYITDPAWEKSLTPEEYADLTEHRIRVWLLDETTADYMVNGPYAGFAGGAARARICRGRANAIGAVGTIFYSLDIGAAPAQIDAALEFLAGAASVDPGGVGAYGEYAFVTKAMDSGYPAFGTVAWSGGQRDPRAVAWQLGTQTTIAGVVCDVDDLNPTAPDPAADPTPASTPEDDMPAFSEGQIKPGTGAVTIVCPPPANLGSAGWGNVWFSMGCDFGKCSVRVAIYTHGAGWSEIDNIVQLDAAGDRVNPHGGPLPTGVQKISITREDNPDVPVGYLIEATHR